MTPHLWERFADPEYLRIYNESLIDSTVATQIQTMREQRDWTQTDLAKRAGMKQSRISEMEDADYSSWTVTTLRRLAAAFGCGLIVRFAPPSEIMDWANGISADSMRPMNYEAEQRARSLVAQAEADELNGRWAAPQAQVIRGAKLQENFGFMRQHLALVEKPRREPQPPWTEHGGAAPQVMEGYKNERRHSA